MQKLFTHFKTKIANQQGTILIITALIILSIGFLLMIMVEVGRTMIVREQLQTAADSAALAAANSGTHRFVTITVTYDPGYDIVYDDEGEAEIVDCGDPQQIPGITENEKELLDEEGWREYAPEVCPYHEPPFYTITDRWIQYDILVGSWSLSTEEVMQVRSGLKNAVMAVLRAKGYPYQQQIQNTIQNLTLEQITELLNSEYNWRERYFAQNNYNTEYCTAYYTHPRYGDGCEERQTEAYLTFNKIHEKYQWLLGLIESLETISSPIQHSAIAMSADDAASSFFQANLPKHAEESSINQIDVYNYTQRDSPYYPSVVVRATAKIKSLFPNLFGVDSYNTDICAQGSTYYKAPQDEGSSGRNESARWSRPPADACWEEP